MTTAAATTGMSRVMENHGRADYRAGRPYNPHGGADWQRGWTDEAHLAAQAARAPAMTIAMAGFAALDALEAARRVISQCVTAKPTRRQAEILSEARPLIDDAILRLEPASRRNTG